MIAIVYATLASSLLPRRLHTESRLRGEQYTTIESRDVGQLRPSDDRQRIVRKTRSGTMLIQRCTIPTIQGYWPSFRWVSSNKKNYGWCHPNSSATTCRQLKHNDPPPSLPLSEDRATLRATRKNGLRQVYAHKSLFTLSIHRRQMSITLSRSSVY